MNTHAVGSEAETPHVAALFLYPIKSAAGIAVTSFELDWRGPIGDRRLMVVDRTGRFITQRECHRLALLQPSFATLDRAGDLFLDAPHMPRLHLMANDGGSAHDAESGDGQPGVRSAQIWDDIVPVDDCGDAVAEWMSAALGRECRLVRIADHARRPLAPRFAGMLPHESRDVTLSDGAPLLLVGRASIAALNGRLAAIGESAMTVERFRPNLLLDGTTAHEEDTWGMVRVGDLQIGVGSQCPRCAITTIDPVSVAQGVEPLRTLAQYRRVGGGVVFGMNATHARPGKIDVGQAVQVVQLR